MTETVHRKSPIRIVNCAEIANEDWTFLQKYIRRTITLWSFHTASARYWIERVVRKPKLARYRSALFAAAQARSAHADVVISHLPRTTLWVAVFSKLLAVPARHLAFSFNFTDLPGGAMRKLMRLAFRQVDRFVVYSSAEKDLYAGYFGLDPAKIDMLHWCMETPDTGKPTPVIEGKYVCAVGGEGRDYNILLGAAEQLPHIQFVIVTRPYSMPDQALPANVSILTNVAADAYWNIVAHSRFVIVPLKSPETNCGHITIVGSQLLNKPIVSTFSSGTADYLADAENALLSPAGDLQALTENISRLWRDEALQKTLSDSIAQSNHRYALQNWVDYAEDYFIRAA